MIIKAMPDIRAITERLYLSKLEDFALLVNMHSPAAADIFTLAAFFILVGIFGAMA